MAASAGSAGKPVLFHSRCGKYAAVENGGRTARRTKLSEFNHAVVLTNLPIKDNQLFEIELIKLTARWAGSIEIGFTTHSPDRLEFPATMTNMTSGTWMVSGKGVIHNRSNVKRDLGFDLDGLVAGQRIGVMRKESSALVLFIDGEEVEIVATGVPTNVYGVVDLYGMCISVKLTAPAPPPTPPPPRTTTATGQGDGNRLLPGAVDPAEPVAFHTRCGENVEIGPDRRSAFRPQPYQEFTRATAFTNRPLNPNEWFEVTLKSVVECWSGSLQMGVTLESPDNMDMNEVDEAADIKKAWVLSASELFHNCQVLLEDYCLDLDDVPLGGRVAVCVTKTGQLRFALNGIDLGCAAENVPQGVYGVVDIYGNCSRVFLTKFTLADDSGVSIVEPTPTHRSTAPPGQEHKFHARVGEMVRLSSENMKATRTGSYTDAIVFSANPLTSHDMFEVELVTRDSKWTGPLKIGLTSCDPSLLPSLPPFSSQLPANTWLLSRSAVYHNGVSIKENYSHRLLRMKVGDRVGVQRCANGTMHVLFNGEDLGPAAQGIAETTYAVVDMYGSAKSVMITSKASYVPAHPPPPRLTTSPVYSLVNPPEAPLPTYSPPLSLPIRLSQSCGSNVHLRTNLRSARRMKSSDHGIVLSEIVIPDFVIFEVVIKHINRKWHGSLAIGMTTIPPSQACLEPTATDISYNTLVISGDKVYVDGQEQCVLSSGISLNSLGVGDRVGLLTTPENLLSLYINGEEMDKLQYHPMSEKYGLVDMFGQCDEVVLNPLTVVPVPTSAMSDNYNSNLLESRKKRSKRLVVATTVLLPLKSAQDSCEYYQLCQRYLRLKLALPDVFFDPTPSYSKCYCSSCSPQTEEVKKRGDPPQTYTLPLGWIKFAIRVPPQALAQDIFNNWHVAYYGTIPGRVRQVLDSGQLLSQGEFATNDGWTQAQLNEVSGANTIDSDQVFVTPSIRYCSMGKEYSKWDEFRDADTNRKYRVQVAFKLCIQPNSYRACPQSLLGNSEPIDLHFNNSELSWRTASGAPVYLYGLLVRVHGKC